MARGLGSRSVLRKSAISKRCQASREQRRKLSRAGFVEVRRPGEQIVGQSWGQADQCSIRTEPLAPLFKHLAVLLGVVWRREARGHGRDCNEQFHAPGNCCFKGAALDFQRGREPIFRIALESFWVGIDRAPALAR